MGIDLPSVKSLKAYLTSVSKIGLLKSPLLYFGAFLIALLGFLGNLSSPLTLLSGADAGSGSSGNLFLSSDRASLSESPQFLLVQGSGLIAAAPPEIITPQSLGALFLSSEKQNPRKVIVEYIAERGDTLSSLASEFEVSVETLLWANNLAKSSVLKVGQKIVVPPASGVIHHVKDKDTISGIAEAYKASAEEIIAFNELPDGGKIYIGDILIVPGGKMPKPASKSQLAPQNVPLGDSNLMCPSSSCKISQGLHWYNAIDFSGNCGDPVRAAAAGQVVKVAQTGSVSRYAFGGAGSHITLLHPNGITTLYAHIAQSLVSQGESVSQGQTIALMGGQPGTPGAGLSTGCHVHFGVTGARNPFSR